MPSIPPDLSKRDQALARVAGIMAEGWAHRPHFSVQDTVQEDVTPINIEEVAEAAPPQTVVAAPTPAPAADPALAKPEKPQAAAVEKKKAQAGQHWFFQTLILLFVLVWVFILGIFIGRGYLMESTAGRELIAWIEDKMDRQPAVPQISIEQPAESAAAERSPAPGPEAATEPPAAPPMIEPQGAEAPENAVLQTVVSAAQSVGPDTAPVPPAAPEEALADSPVFLTPETLAEEAPTESEPAAPAVFIPPPPVAPPVAASAASGGYAVQATYALNEQAAQAVVDRLKRQGLQAYFYENSRKQYLIRVGHFQNIEEARSAREKLSSLGYKDPYISRLTTEE